MERVWLLRELNAFFVMHSLWEVPFMFHPFEELEASVHTLCSWSQSRRGGVAGSVKGIVGETWVEGSFSLFWASPAISVAFMSV